jgi:sugar-specific transcriptional regulator TrmB
MVKLQSLKASEKTYLRKLGLSKHAIELYALLLQQSGLTARQAAGLSGEFPAAEYRLFKQLENFGLILRERGRPVRFVALPKDVGLRAAYMQSRTALNNLVQKIGLAGEDQTGLELIISRQAVYERYAELAAQARREICIYAIGIAYSEELLEAQQAAIKRGVRIRHVLQQIKPSNFHVAHSWQRLGVQVRYEPAERGFHLMLFDDQRALITFSDPKNTDDRLSILTDNVTAVRLFQAYFQDIWHQARKVKL